MLKNKSKILFAALFVTIGLFVSNAALAQTDQEKSNCDTFQGYLGPLATGLPKFCSAAQILTWAISRLLVFAGTVTVLFLIIGGFFYVTAAGNEEQSEKGKKILVNSAIGLVIILMSATIVRIVAGTLTSSPTGGSAPPVNQGSSGGSGGGGTSTGQIQFTGAQTAAVSSDYQFGAIIPDSIAKQFCGSSNPTFYSTLEEKNGNIITLANIGGDVSGGQTTVNFDAGQPSDYGYDPSAIGQTMRVVLYVCGQNASAWNINLQASSVSTAPSAADVQAAVSRSKYSVLTASGGSSFSVYARALSSDIQTMCTDASDPGVKLLVGTSSGSNLQKSYPTSVLLSVAGGTSALLESGISSSQYSSANVQVYICGHAISQE